METNENTNQKKIFMDGEGNNWFSRNKEELYKKTEDVIVDYIKGNNIKKDNFLEIGCSDGWRLNLLNKIYPDSSFYGIDPSSKAITDGLIKYPKLNLKVSTADELTFSNGLFSNVIIGFCLYLIDRNLLFKVAYEVDRILSDNGYLFILDFLPNHPYENVYSHDKRVKSYKMNYSDIFSWHPYYNISYLKSFSHSSLDFHNDVDERIGLIVLKKIVK